MHRNEAYGKLVGHRLGCGRILPVGRQGIVPVKTSALDRGEDDRITALCPDFPYHSPEIFLIAAPWISVTPFLFFRIIMSELDDHPIPFAYVFEHRPVDTACDRASRGKTIDRPVVQIPSASKKAIKAHPPACLRPGFHPFVRAGGIPKQKYCRHTFILDNGPQLQPISPSVPHQAGKNPAREPRLTLLGKEHGIPLKTIHITTKEAAQKVPAPVTTYALFRNGKFVTQRIQSDKKFLALAGVEE